MELPEKELMENENSVKSKATGEGSQGSAGSWRLCRHRKAGASGDFTPHCIWIWCSGYLWISAWGTMWFQGSGPLSFGVYFWGGARVSVHRCYSGSARGTENCRETSRWWWSHVRQASPLLHCLSSPVIWFLPDIQVQHVTLKFCHICSDDWGDHTWGNSNHVQ